MGVANHNICTIEMVVQVKGGTISKWNTGRELRIKWQMHSLERKKMQNLLQFLLQFLDGLIPLWRRCKLIQNYNTLSSFFKKSVVGPWDFKEGVLFFKNRIYLDYDSPLLQDIILVFHSRDTRLYPAL